MQDMCTLKCVTIQTKALPVIQNCKIDTSVFLSSRVLPIHKISHHTDTDFPVGQKRVHPVSATFLKYRVSLCN